MTIRHVMKEGDFTLHIAQQDQINGSGGYMDWKPGLYKTKRGKTVEVIAVRGDKVIGMDGDDVETWDLDGRYLQSESSSLDLIPDSRATA